MLRLRSVEVNQFDVSGETLFCALLLCVLFCVACVPQREGIRVNGALLLVVVALFGSECTIVRAVALSCCDSVRKVYTYTCVRACAKSGSG